MIAVKATYYEANEAKIMHIKEAGLDATQKESTKLLKKKSHTSANQDFSSQAHGSPATQASEFNSPYPLANHVPEPEPPATHTPDPLATHLPKPEPHANHVPEPEPLVTQYKTHVSELETQAYVEQKIQLKKLSQINHETLTSLLNDEDFEENVILDIQLIRIDTSLAKQPIPAK